LIFIESFGENWTNSCCLWRCQTRIKKGKQGFWHFTTLENTNIYKKFDF